MVDHRHVPPMWTTTLGNVGKSTTNNFRHGNTAQNISPDTKTAIGKQWHHCKEKGWWDSQTTTPTHPQQTTEPGTACWAIPGTSQQQFGSYSSCSCPPIHKPYQSQSSFPTSRRWQPFGRPQLQRGDQPTILPHNITCHSSTGNNTYTGPVHTTNKDISPSLLIRPYIGRYNNSDKFQTSNRSDKTSFAKYRHWQQSGMMSHSNGSWHYRIIASQHTNSHIWSHRSQYYTIYSLSYNTLMRTYCYKSWPQDSHSSDSYNQDSTGKSAQTINIQRHNPEWNSILTTDNTSWRNYNRVALTHTGSWWQTRLPKKSKWAEWTAPSEHPSGGHVSQSHYNVTNTHPTSSHYHTPTPSSPWPSASNRQAPMATPRSEGGKTGDVAVTTDHATWPTNHIITPSIITFGLRNIPQPQTEQHNRYGDMTMTEPTANYRWMTQAWRMSSF